MVREVEAAALLSDLELPRCVASWRDLNRIQLSLRVSGLEKYFEPSWIFSAEMVLREKPEPDLFLHAA
ncbi:MAG: hypothetical protein P8R42_04875 [Candidatus Binatia bacterium]|nr:hypothetical protein [Candidatus Binatia bacterium]